MKWMLVMVALGLNGPQTSAVVGPYDDQKGCVAVAQQLVVKDGWSKVYCYPIGTIELKKPEPEAPKGEKKKP